MDAQVQEKGLDFQQVWRMFAETRAQIEASDAKLTRLFAETRERFAEMRERFAETREQIEATDKQVEKTSEQVAALSSKWGRFVEGLVAPAALRLFAERGIPLDGTTQRAKRSRAGENMEIDILAVNGEYAVLIEVKSTLKADDVRDHIKQLGKFKTFFPEYADRKVVGAVAGIVIDGDADKFAYKRGLFVLVQSGELVEIANDEEFRPKLW